MAGETRVDIKVNENYEGRLLRDFLLKANKISKKGLCKLKNKGKILCNGQEVTVRQVLSSGDLITLIYPTEQVSQYLFPQPIPISIVYEDQDLILLDKNAGICVHPTKGYPSGTLANGLLYHYNQKGEAAGFHAVNRLDKDTSGLILIAKNGYAKQQLFIQQQHQEFRRTYLALVHGQVKLETGIILAPIRKIEGKTIKREVHPDGQTAVTNYQTINRFKNYSLVRMQLKTGRTHQIRIHMSSIDHPLVGDELYGGSTKHIARQALHADSLKFFHPRNKKEMKFTSALPDDINNCLKLLIQDEM